MGWAEHVARMGDRRGVYGILVRRHERKRTLETSNRDGKIILKWIFKKWNVVGIMNRIDLIQDRGRWCTLVNAVINLRVLQTAG
jgi:hypothetical protein